MTYTTFMGLLLTLFSILALFKFPPLIAFQNKCKAWMESNPDTRQKLDKIQRSQGNEKSRQAFEHFGYLLMLLAGIALIIQGLLGK